MSGLLSDRELHDYLDRIGKHGCKAVNRLIAQAEQGQPIPEIRHLDKAQQRQVLTELKKAMSVYTDCNTGR